MHLNYHQSCGAQYLQVFPVGQNNCRYGAGNFDWKEFVPRLKQKTFEEINEYGLNPLMLFSSASLQKTHHYKKAFWFIL